VQVKLVHALAIEGLVAPPAAPATEPAFPVWTRDETQKLREAAHARAFELLRSTGVSGTVEINDARPAEALVAVAEWERARLICVGTAGHTGLRRIVLGSVAEEVVRKAKCPVLVARPQA
jgi:nucleotide-binding universal stress UspA family protein